MKSSRIDSQNMYEVLKDFPKQIEQAYALGKDIIPKPFDRIIVAGMGGSALPGGILQALHPALPITLSRGYTLPPYANKNTLVFVISHSGNTEETLASLSDGLSKGCQNIIITSGGALQKIAKEKKLPLVLVPSGGQPRMSYGYLFFPILRILENAKKIPDQEQAVEESIAVLSDPALEDNGKRIAEKLKDKIPLIYSSDSMAIASYKWKINFNENTKILAFSNVLPEMNHNEINGFSHAVGEYVAVMLTDDEDHERDKNHERIGKRMAITKGLIGKAGFSAEIVSSRGKSLMARLFSLIIMGDWASYLLSLAYGRDPSPVPVIEDLKKQLRQ
ncbi:MAG TPA: bifunctional phosphoglucose/phosphomannose isomerase [Candidatus Nanoarchaeia archaeon]|nr:bifunctional phosphoglucose/phosphomannose isomerase [Candidatus Nanoarchaeia archaeon]